jgi:hypothetical protein
MDFDYTLLFRDAADASVLTPVGIRIRPPEAEAEAPLPNELEELKLWKRLVTEEDRADPAVCAEVNRLTHMLFATALQRLKARDGQ